MTKKVYVDPQGLNEYHEALMAKLESLITANVPADWTGVNPFTALRTQINQLVALLDNPEQVSTAIDTFNEIVDFLAGIDPDGTTLKQFIDLIQAKVQAADSSIQIVYDQQNPTAAGTGIKVNLVKNKAATPANVSGLEVASDSGSGETGNTAGLRVKAGTAIQVGSNGVGVKLGKGIAIGNSNEIVVKEGEGIKVDSNGVHVKPAGDNTLGGIKLGYTTDGNNKPVQVDSNGKAYVDVGDNGVSSVEITGTSPISVVSKSGDSASTPKKDISLLIASSKAVGQTGGSGLEVVGSGDTYYNPGLKVNAGDGLQIDLTDGKLKAKLSTGFAIDTNGGIKLIEGGGIGVSSSGVHVKLKNNGGLTFDGTDIKVAAGDGITITSNGVEADPDDFMESIYNKTYSGSKTYVDAIVDGTYSAS